MLQQHFHREIDQLKESIAQLGGMRIAAPPAGVPRGESVDMDAAAERYHELLNLGDEMGVVPQIEMWGGNATIGSVEKALYIAIKAGHPKACFLGDVYHTYKGGSSFDSILMMGPHALKAYHMNDYPAEPERSKIADRDRVFPGDGVCELPTIIAMLIGNGFKGTFSLELFNPEYWKREAVDVAREGLQKSRDVVKAALAVA